MMMAPVQKQWLITQFHIRLCNSFNRKMRVFVFYLFFFSSSSSSLLTFAHYRYKGTKWNMHENDHFIVIYACHIHFIRHFNYIIVDDMYEITLSQQRFRPLQCLYQSQRTNWLNSNRYRTTHSLNENIFLFNFSKPSSGQRETMKNNIFIAFFLIKPILILVFVIASIGFWLCRINKVISNSQISSCIKTFSFC